MGKDGEHAEFNMDSQSTQLQKLGWRDDGAAGLDGQGAANGDRDYNKLLKKNVKYIV